MNEVPGVLAASITLQHVPDLVRFGSKPMRDGSDLPAARSFEDAVSYLPNQAMIGGVAPESLWEIARPWWEHPIPSSSASPQGRSGEILPAEAFYELLDELDDFGLVRMGHTPGARELPLHLGDALVGAFAPDHEQDESLTANVLLENLSCKASAVHATRWLLERGAIDPASIDHVLNCGEEAVGDRYQRGGGNLGKAIAEGAGLSEASGADVKAFCAGPLHALIHAAALVAAGVHERVLVVAGGSLAKLGMKSGPAARKGIPVLEDVLAACAILVGPVGGSDDGPRIRLDAIGSHRVASGSSQQALLEDLIGRPLDAMARRIDDIDRFATELHNPDITEPAGGGDVADRNYRMFAGLGVVRGELDASAIDVFGRERGLPGFSPTQGHIASAIPWVPHALERMREGTMRTTMLVAKGSLFLGRMTRLWDGASITLEV